MTFPTISPRNESPYDHFLSLLDGPYTATDTGTPILFDITAAPSATRCIVGSAGYEDYDADTAHWTVSLEVSKDFDGDYVPIGSLVVPEDAGNYSFGVSGQGVYKILPTARYVRAVATLEGLAGPATFEVYLGA